MENKNKKPKVQLDIHREKLNLFMKKLKHSVNLGNDFKRRVNIKVKYFFEVNKTEQKSSIELKIGEDKLYVVKNSKNFLNVVKHKDIMEFGKQFYYNGKSCEFRGNDNKVIQLLTELYDFGEFMAEDGNVEGNYQKLFKGKRTYLSSNYVKRLFNYLIGKRIDLNIYGKEYSNIEVVQEELPLEFTMNEDYEEFFIEQNGKMAMPLITEGGIFYFKNKIYITTDRQNELYKYFYNMLREKGGIKFKQDDLKEVGTYVIPLLQSISKEIYLDEKVSKIFHNESLNANIFLDREGNNVIASLRYEYGNITFNPLKSLEENYNSQLIIRDIKLEKSIEQIFKTYGFEEYGFNLVLREPEDILFFLREGVEKLRDKGNIYYSDDFKKLKINRAQSITSKLSIVQDFLEFDFDIDGVEKEELKEVLENLQERKSYYRLKNGSFLDLNSDSLKELYNILQYLDVDVDDIDGNSLMLSKFNALYLNKKLSDTEYFENDSNEYVEKLCDNIGNYEPIDFKVDSRLEAILRSYQKVGFNWLKTIAHYGFGGILADEMGLGKTLQAISLMTSLEEGEEQGISLVVCPTSLVYNWKYEIEKFAPHLNVSIISGSKDNREGEIEELQSNNVDVVISSYGLIRNDIEKYKEINFKYCFLDEAQNIKNYNSLVSIAVKQLNAKSKFALTGTPIENSLMELWSIFDFIMPRYLLDRQKFASKYESPIVKQKDRDVLEELNSRIRPFILRRLKQDVAIELPPKIEHKLMVEMTEEQKKVYAAYTLSYKEQITQEISKNGFTKSKFKILALLTKLRQICCDPSIILENYNNGSGKLEILDELLEEMLNGGHKILIFSQFTRVLASISELLKKRGIEYYYLDGTTKSEERMYLVNKFNEDKTPVFLISLKAGGTGLNLTGADVVIHFDPWWNPAVEDQATDRSHRIGQRKSVEVIKLISKGTIEEKIYKLQESKKHIIDSVMNDMDEGYLWDMNEEDIKNLFEF